MSKTVLLDSFDRWGRVNVSRLAAAFSFFAILSLAPSLLFAVLVAARFLGSDETALAKLMTFVRENLGEQTAPFVQDLLKSAQKPTTGTVAAIIGFIVTFFSASNLFLQFNDAVDAIWERKREGHFASLLLFARLRAFALVLAFGAAFLAFLIVDAGLTWFRHNSGLPDWTGTRILVSILFTTALLTVLFRTIPRGKVRFLEALPGALFAALGLTALRFVLGQYFALTGVFKAYGAAGALVAILLWFFYSAQIVFYGVVLSRAVAALREVKAEPGKVAA